jgi:hypothetical protein
MERNSKSNNAVISDVKEKISNEPAVMMDRVEMALKRSTVDLYAPPYMLPLCNEMKRFDDFTGDGSVTKNSVEEDAVKIQRQIDARGAVGVQMPEVVSIYCREVLSDPTAALFDRSEKASRDAILLSSFGWSLCDDNDSSEKVMGVLLRCHMCLSRSILACAEIMNEEESPKKKKRRIDMVGEANIKLLESHRAYCPYVSGFASGVSRQSKPGWKVVLSNLHKEVPSK